MIKWLILSFYVGVIFTFIVFYFILVIVGTSLERVTDSWTTKIQNKRSMHKRNFFYTGKSGNTALVNRESLDKSTMYKIMHNR